MNPDCIIAAIQSSRFNWIMHFIFQIRIPIYAAFAILHIPTRYADIQNNAGVRIGTLMV